MSFRTKTTVYLGVAVFFFIFATTVSARPFRIGKLPAKVGLKAGDKYTKDLGAMDSDKDGFSNDMEFAAGTHPGDFGSKPEK